jgi:hypothetical protein
VHTQFNDQWILERAPQQRAPRAINTAVTPRAERICAVHSRAHVEKRPRWALALSKHPRWIDRDT